MRRRTADSRATRQATILGGASTLAGLLVSVRSVAEAWAALGGGAAVIDIKEPGRGPLGRADPATWRDIRAMVPPAIPVSVALGELLDLRPDSIRAADLAGIAFAKAGPAGLGDSWAHQWDQAYRDLPPPTGLVAVIYADWAEARAPHPDLVIDQALRAASCPGVLVDSWDKARACPIHADAAWRDRIARVQAAGRFVALAGRLDHAAIERLGPLRPDLFAVRGAACSGGDRRHGMIDAERVAELAALAHQVG